MAANGRFVSYFRVSTTKQGQSGLGLEAQREAVAKFVERGKWTEVGTFKEVESGKRSDRPELAKALDLCRITGATLIVAKLDRLSRNARFLLSVVEGTGDAGVVFCDLPDLPPGAIGKFFITQMASIAELEAGLISKRTKEALAAAKRRYDTQEPNAKKIGGWRGGPKCDPATGLKARKDKATAWRASVQPMVTELRKEGLSLRQICDTLMERHVMTPNKGKWTPATVSKVLAFLSPQINS